MHHFSALYLIHSSHHTMQLDQLRAQLEEMKAVLAQGEAASECTTALCK